MNRSLALRSLVLGSSLLAAVSCGGGGGGSSARMQIVLASNGFGQMLPHQVRALDSNGIPTDDLINITEIQQILDNVTLSNSVQPPTEWASTATLPNWRLPDETATRADTRERVLLDERSGWRAANAGLQRLRPPHPSAAARLP